MGGGSSTSGIPSRKRRGSSSEPGPHGSGTSPGMRLPLAGGLSRVCGRPKYFRASARPEPASRSRAKNPGVLGVTPPVREHGAACSLWVMCVATIPERVTFGTFALPQKLWPQKSAENAKLSAHLCDPCVPWRQKPVPVLSICDICGSPSVKSAKSADLPCLRSLTGRGGRAEEDLRSPERCARSGACLMRGRCPRLQNWPSTPSSQHQRPISVNQRFTTGPRSRERAFIPAPWTAAWSVPPSRRGVIRYSQCPFSAFRKKIHSASSS